jgi:endonuclease/exonuclease/phosphatase (EEP) superfamily protein YafD
VRLSAAIILACGLTVPVIARAVAGRWPVSTVLAAFAPVAAALAAAVAILVTVTLGWVAVIVWLPALGLIASQLPLRRRRGDRGTPEHPWAPEAAGAQLRILSLNALVGRASVAAIYAEVLRLSPDVVAIQELTPELVEQLTDRGLFDLLPHSELHALPGPRGIGVWSRWPMDRQSLGTDTDRPMLRVQVDLTVQVTMTLVHPDAPRRAARQKRWRHDLSRLLSSLDAVTGLHLLIGDFNASRDMKEFRRVLAAGFADCADSAASRQWPGFTWPANSWLPPLLRLDHILVSRPGALVRECRTVRVPGTDHLAVFAVIELRPACAELGGRAGYVPRLTD